MMKNARLLSAYISCWLARLKIDCIKLLLKALLNRAEINILADYHLAPCQLIVKVKRRRLNSRKSYYLKKNEYNRLRHL